MALILDETPFYTSAQGVLFETAEIFAAAAR